jgi:hypothetical protein
MTNRIYGRMIERTFRSATGAARLQLGKSALYILRNVANKCKRANALILVTPQ